MYKKLFLSRGKNYFHVVVFYFHDVEIYFLDVKIYFLDVKIVFGALFCNFRRLLSKKKAKNFCITNFFITFAA